MALLEKYLTKIPMYLLIAGSLCGIIIAAFFASLLGIVGFSPLTLLVTTLVFTSVSMLVSYLLGKLYSAPSHLPSALITGLILTMLFTPSLAIITLIQYALIAATAQASKYVIAYKQRHIVNPAAFGAFLGGLLGLHFASWWIGSPAFAFLVAITGFLILYKTRQLLIGGVFLTVSLVTLLFAGVTPWLALTLWPLLFIAGFMLSEPLTLPPRKWQKLIVAVAVALLISLPFHIGEVFYSSPEFALLMGNLIAFALAFRQRKGLQLTLKERRPLTPTTEEFVFSSPEILQFDAGQYVEMTLVDGKTDNRGFRRSFSITNAPGSKELRLGIKFAEPGSAFKQALRTLPLGAHVQTTGITGDFVLPKDPAQKLLFIAGGIGITPFMSHLATHADRDITVLYFARDETEFAYRSQLDANHATVHYFTADNKPALTNALLAKYVPDAATRTAYISGPPLMVASVKSLLRGKVTEIKTDYFSGY